MTAARGEDGQGPMGREYEITFSYQPVIDAVEEDGIGLAEYDELRDGLEAFFGEEAQDWLRAGFENTAQEYLPDTAEASFEGLEYDHTAERGGTMMVAVDEELDDDAEQQLYRAISYAAERMLHHTDPLGADRALDHELDQGVEDPTLLFSLEQG